MKPCRKVGIDVTWRCQWRCRSCFYRRNPHLGKPTDVPWMEVCNKIRRAKEGGLDHVVAVGHGEPSLYPDILNVLNYCRGEGMATSMITTGATGLWRFNEFYDNGLDHLHISSHGIGETLDRITGTKGGFDKQTELKDHLQTRGLPFRTNVTIQRENYQELPELASHECDMGVWHFVFLGFIPIYEWGTDKAYVQEVAVPPAELRPYIEDAAEILLAMKRHFTIRYQPLCHLSPKYWPYVTNARFVFFDQYEWNYELQAEDTESLWRASKRMGDGLGNHYPCHQCVAYHWCGGWNKKYAEAFDGADLKPIKKVPEQYQEVWETRFGLLDLNPVNLTTGTLRTKTWRDE